MLGGEPLQIAVSNDLAYVLISGPVGGMRVVDVSNPLTPAIVGDLEITSPNFGNGQIAVRDSFVYLMATDDILRVVDGVKPILS